MIQLVRWQLLLAIAYCSVCWFIIGYYLGQALLRRAYGQQVQQANQRMEEAMQSLSQYQIAEDLLRQVTSGSGQSSAEPPKNFWN